MAAEWLYWDPETSEWRPLFGDLALHRSVLSPGTWLFEVATQKHWRAEEIPQLQREFLQKSLREVRETIVGCGGLIIYAGTFVLLSWIVVALVGGAFRVPEAAARSQEPFAATQIELTLQLQPEVIRGELFRFSNVRFFVNSDAINAFPYPDRKEVVRGFGKSWCSHAPWYHFGTFELRSADDGKLVGHYSCTVRTVTPIL